MDGLEELKWQCFWLVLNIFIMLADPNDRSTWKVLASGIDASFCYHAFFSSKTREVLRPWAATQDIAKHIGFSGATSKHAFHMWVTNMNRLPTHCRLASWGLQVQMSCCICSFHLETRDHLMLSCPFVEVYGLKLVEGSWTSSSLTATPTNLRMMVVQALVMLSGIR